MRILQRRGLSAIAALALIVGSIAIATPASAAPDTWLPDPITAPADGTLVADGPVVLSWTPLDGYTGNYRVIYTRLGSLPQTVQTTDTSLTLPTVDGRYSWRVGYRTGPGILAWNESHVASFTVDTVAPVVTIVTPLTAIPVAPGADVNLSAIVADPTFMNASITVDGVAPPIVVGDNDPSTITDQAILQTLSTVGLLPGEHTIAIDAVDAAGRHGYATRIFVIDGTAPEVNFDSPLDGASVNPAVSTPFSASFNELANWRYLIDGSEYATGFGLAVSSDIPVSSWEHGTGHTLTIEATDLRGNAGSSSITVYADSKGPKLTIDYPPASGVAGDLLRIYGTARDRDSGLASVWVDITVAKPNGKCNPAAVPFASFSAEIDGWDGYAPYPTHEKDWSVDIDTSGYDPAALYCVKVTATDAFGYANTEKVTPIVIDHTPPDAFTLISPSGWLLQSGTFQWNSSADAHGISYYRVHIYDQLAGETVGEFVTTDTELATDLPPGEYAWGVTAVDEAGNETPTTEFGIGITGIPEIKKPDGGDVFTDSLLVKWSGVHAPGLVDHYQVRFIHEGGEKFTKNVDADKLKKNVDFSGRPDGEWTVKVRAVFTVDLAFGNRTPWSDPVVVTKDTEAPETPTLLTPTFGKIQNLGDITFTWSAPAGTDHYEFRTSPNSNTDGDGKLTDGDSFDTDLPTYALTASTDGTNWWQVRAIDAAGNVGDWTAPWKVTADHSYVPPTPPAPPKKTFASTGGDSEEVVTEPTAEPTPSAEPTDEPTAEPSDGDNAGAGDPEAQDKPVDSGFPVGWLIAGILVLVLGALAFLARFLFFRRG